MSDTGKKFINKFHIIYEDFVCQRKSKHHLGLENGPSFFVVVDLIDFFGSFNTTSKIHTYRYMYKDHFYQIRCCF